MIVRIFIYSNIRAILLRGGMPYYLLGGIHRHRETHLLTEKSNSFPVSQHENIKSLVTKIASRKGNSPLVLP